MAPPLDIPFEREIEYNEDRREVAQTQGPTRISCITDIDEQHLRVTLT